MIFALVTLALPGVAYAVCASPAGVAGEVRFDLSDRAVEYCDGLNWVSLPKRGAQTCTGTTGTWASTTVGTANSTWTAATYGAGRFVAVANSGTDRIATSTDGVTWTAVTAPVSATWFDVVYGNGQFVAISQSNNVMRSPDGLNWTAHTVPEANQWNGITYGNGYFVAVARNGTNRVMRSADGATWTAHAAAQANQWFDVTYGNGMFVAVTTAGTNQIMTSTDGASWAVGTIPSNSWSSIAYGNGLFIATSLNAPNNVTRSADTVTWTSSTPNARAWNNVDFYDGMFIVVADNTSTTNSFLTSTDGISWTGANSPQANGWTSGVIANGTLVAVASIGTNRGAVSSCANGQSYDWSIALPQLYIPHPTTSWWDFFGTGIATDGLHIVAGAPGSDVGINNNGLVFVLDAADGSVLHTINNPATGDTDNFGYDNAIDGNLFVSSAVYSDIGATDTGRVYVFNTSTGTLVSTLVNPNVTADDNFGASVAISGNLVAVGTPYNDNGAANAGSVYIFNATTGALVTTIHNPAPAVDDHFGSAVDIDGNLVVIGATDDDPGGNSSAGSVYVFNATTGALVSTWANPLPSPNDGFGYAVAIDGNIAIAGPGTQHALVTYSFNATTGAAIATFTNPDTPGGSDFGRAVDIDGQFAVIGSSRNDESGSNSGAAFLYNVNTGSLVSSFYNTQITNGNENLGCAVSMKNGIIAAAACLDDIGESDGDSGSIHTFASRSYCSNPTQPAGAMIYNDDHRVVQWCDGGTWQPAGPVDPSGPTGGCTTPTATAGYVMFSSNSCTLQYCDGGTWQSMGGIPADPCACDPDAGTWTAQTMPQAGNWRGVVYGNGMFVAASNARPASSPDGINWTVNNSVDLQSSYSGMIAYGNGLFVVPSTGGGNRRVTTSPDGVNWTAHNTALPSSWPPTGGIEAITYGGGLFVAVGSDGAIATSPDGTTWTARTSGVTTSFTGVTYGNGLYVAVGTWVGAVPTHPVAVSPDGINWTGVTAANVFNAKWTRIAFGEGRFVAMSYQSSPYFMYSSDGVNWSAGDPGNVYSGDGHPLIYANGRFVASGDGSGNTIYTSEDGITWSVLAASVPHNSGAIAYGNGTFVTVQDGTNLMRATCAY